MSGGHFDYIQFQIDGAASEIDTLLKVESYSSKLHSEIIEKFIEARNTLRKAATMLHRIDWLVSGDDGNETFLKRWDEDLSKL